MRMCDVSRHAENWGEIPGTSLTHLVPLAIYANTLVCARTRTRTHTHPQEAEASRIRAEKVELLRTKLGIISESVDGVVSAATKQLGVKEEGLNLQIDLCLTKLGIFSEVPPDHATVKASAVSGLRGTSGVRSPISASRLSSPMTSLAKGNLGEWVAVGVVMSNKEKTLSTPKTGNKASSFMPWQQINKSPVMVLSKFQDSDESSSTEDEEEEAREETEKRPKGDDLDDTPSLWGGGSHALIRIESLDGNRALCAPRNSPGYYAARREAEQGRDGRTSSWGAYVFATLENETNQAATAAGCHSPYGRPRAHGLPQLEMVERGLRKPAEGGTGEGFARVRALSVLQKGDTLMGKGKGKPILTPHEKVKAARAENKEKRRREREARKRSAVCAHAYVCVRAYVLV